MSEQTVDKFIAEIISELKQNRLKLPTLPEVATRVQKTLENDNATASLVAKAVGSDVALSARLIQVANSPLYRGSKKIESVQMAVARLGLKVCRNLVMSLVMQQLFQTKSEVLRSRMKKLWEHSVEVAAISRILAQKFTRLDPELAMLGGLIHDIGAIPIITHADNYPVLANSPGLLDDAIERLHTNLGRLILETWQFSPELIPVAAEHEKLDRQADGADYADVVLVANLHSYIGEAEHRHGGIDLSAIPAFERLGLTTEASIAAMQEAEAEIAETKRLIGG